jgi:tRNA pseudouridine38-40 synthase
LRLKIVIAYNGRDFFGSQEQPNKRSVVGDLHHSLKRLHIDSKVFLSGRTDRDVHATGQVLHVDIPDFWDIAKFKYAFEKGLSSSISIISINKVSEDFHSRFSAKKRSYRYIFSLQKRDPFRDGFITFLERDDFNLERVQEAINEFRGTHNFQFFKKMGSDNHSDIRTIFDTKAYKYEDYFIFKFKANSFLRSQVRMMSKFLIEIGFGNLSKRDLIDQLSGERVVLKNLAPPNGLYLTRIDY